LPKRHHQSPAELTEQDGGATHRRQRQPGEKPRFDVVREVGARGDRAEHRAQQERDREGKGGVADGREATDL
jgi:hypothetical protein